MSEFKDKLRNVALPIALAGGGLLGRELVYHPSTAFAAPLNKPCIVDYRPMGVSKFDSRYQVEKVVDPCPIDLSKLEPNQQAQEEFSIIKDLPKIAGISLLLAIPFAAGSLFLEEEDVSDPA